MSKQKSACEDLQVHPPMDALITFGCSSAVGPVGTPPLVGDLPPGPGGAPHADAIYAQQGSEAGVNDCAVLAGGGMVTVRGG